MDIFNKKKVKQLEWDVIALKARLESKTSELDRVNNAILKMYDSIEEEFDNLYADKYIIVGGMALKITKFSCQGGTPYVMGEIEGDQVKAYLSWGDVLNLKTVKKPKIKK